MPQFQAHIDRSLENRVAHDMERNFRDRYPRNIEHCLRLMSERLMLGLDKRDGVNPADTTTWRMTPDELRALSQSLDILDQINRRNRNAE